ncbi:MAG: hypothetical protein ACK5L0_05985 [Candidatus Fimivivens sp.]
MTNEWRIHTVYDEAAYRALTEACWQLFRKPKMQTQVYPILITFSVITLATALMSDDVQILPAIILIIFFLAAIPLGKVSAKAKMYRTAVKTGGVFSEAAAFVFTNKSIRATMAERTFDIPYQKVFCFACLNHWRFLFFDVTSAYIINTNNLQNREDIKNFDDMIQEKCGLTMIRLKIASTEEPKCCLT